MKQLFIEIGTEELPAIPFLKELPNIIDKFHASLEAHKLKGQCLLDYTPRRLVVYGSIADCQNDSIEEFFGPPVNIAYQNGSPSKAFESFLKRCDADAQSISAIHKDGKEILYYQKHHKGMAAELLLEQIVRDFIQKLTFGKTMRWGSITESFIRPVRSIAVLLDDVLIPMCIFGVESKKTTFVHRSVAFEAQSFETHAEYTSLLERNGVILSASSRREKILTEIRAIEKQHGLEVSIDEDLLDEIVCITEYPTALLGHFDEKFLHIPKEVIITSMKEHQRYFATFKDEKLYNGFVVVSNAFNGNMPLIVKGNERVLRARLSDALFFYENDVQHGFDCSGLENVRFVEGLGSMADKVRREGIIAAKLATMYEKHLAINHSPAVIMDFVKTACALSKADLLSESVTEFTELQGIIGGYLATHLGYDPLIVDAIKDQYLPKSHDDVLPRNAFAALLALAYRLDNLFGLFSIAKIPSGSKDPFSLRRSANAIIRIAVAFEFRLDVYALYDTFASEYKAFDKTLLEQFIFERLAGLYTVNPSLITAVLASGIGDLCAIDKRLKALGAAEHNELNALGHLFKRVANITHDMDLDNLTAIQTDILNASEELELYHAFTHISMVHFSDTTEELHALLGLREILDRYFDKVLVNAPDEALRNNRKTLLAQIYKLFLNIADFKEISI